MNIGDTIYGFKFKSKDYPDIEYSEHMDKYIGKVARITWLDNDFVYVRMYKSQMNLAYPAKLARKYLTTNKNVLIEKQ
jgi:hypothetical protein